MKTAKIGINLHTKMGARWHPKSTLLVLASRQATPSGEPLSVCFYEVLASDI